MPAEINSMPSDTRAPPWLVGAMPAAYDRHVRLVCVRSRYGLRRIHPCLRIRTMRLQNTSQTQDREIEQAARSLDDLMSILEDLDNEITEWRDAAILWDCGSPDDLKDAINHLKNNNKKTTNIMQPENEITKPTKPRTLKGLLSEDNVKAQFALALPKHLNADRFARVAITALTRTPKLQECTPESFMKCLLDLSALGIEPDGRRAHLIPYGKECTLILDYKGIAELVMRSGTVASIHADKVCVNDAFEVDRGRIVTHKPNYAADRGTPYAYYVLITFKDGSEKSEVMTRDEIELSASVRVLVNPARGLATLTKWRRRPFSAVHLSGCPCRLRFKT